MNVTTATAGPLVECVPNVSEGRRPEVIEKLARAVRSVPGCCLLDVHSDADHNRSVFTFAGSPASVRDAAEALAVAAVELIDLRTHEGVHPRIGAVDVIPFIPLRATDMRMCVYLARQTGRALARRLELPVYLYAEAAAQPGRLRLADLRRDALGPPDFGPDRPHVSAGAVAVGARQVLIAFNAVLATDDLAVARAIARRIRESDGGLPAVQALGVALAGPRRAQVSMNLLDYRRTPLAALVRAVRHEATAAGTEVVAAELVGLAPAEALAGLLPAVIGGELDGIPDASMSIEARLADCAR